MSAAQIAAPYPWRSHVTLTFAPEIDMRVEVCVVLYLTTATTLWVVSNTEHAFCIHHHHIFTHHHFPHNLFAAAS